MLGCVLSSWSAWLASFRATSRGTRPRSKQLWFLTLRRSAATTRRAIRRQRKRFRPQHGQAGSHSHNLKQSGSLSGKNGGQDTRELIQWRILRPRSGRGASRWRSRSPVYSCLVLSGVAGLGTPWPGGSGKEIRCGEAFSGHKEGGGRAKVRGLIDSGGRSRRVAV